jgi:hypothetical protein
MQSPLLSQFGSGICFASELTFQTLVALAYPSVPEPKRHQPCSNNAIEPLRKTLNIICFLRNAEAMRRGYSLDKARGYSLGKALDSGIINRAESQKLTAPQAEI